MATVITSTNSRTQNKLKKFKSASFVLSICFLFSLGINLYFIYTDTSAKVVQKITNVEDDNFETEKRKLENQNSNLISEMKELNQSCNESLKKVNEQDKIIENLKKENESLRGVKEKMREQDNVRKAYNQSLELGK